MRIHFACLEQPILLQILPQQLLPLLTALLLVVTSHIQITCPKEAYSNSCLQFVNTNSYITNHRKCMGKLLRDYILLVNSWTFYFNDLVLEFEGPYNDT